MPSQIAAIVFVLLTVAAVGFQIALACGAPWGEFTLGGKYRGPLPRQARIVPIFSSVLLIGFALVVLARAGLAFADIGAVTCGWVWVVVAYCVLGTIANTITPSRRARALWLPVLILMLACSTVVGMA